ESLGAALQASERSRARSLFDMLTEPRGDITEDMSGDLLRLQREIERKLRAKLESQTALLSSKYNQSEAAAIRKEVADLINQQDDLRSRLRASNPKYSHLTQPQPATLNEIQQQLDGNTLLLEYSLGDKRSYVWLVTPNSIDGFELPARDQIEPVARRVTEALTARNRQEKDESFPQRQLRIAKAEKEYSEASAALSKMVLEPVASLLGRKRLVVVADGALQMVPFAALPVPANSTALLTAIDSAGLAPPSGSAVTQKTMRQPNSSSANGTVVEVRSLIAEHEIVTLPSASVLALQRRELANRKPAPLAVAVLADPVFDLQDARVARATGNGNQHRKDLASSGQVGEVLPKLGVQSSRATSSSGNKQSQLASALRDVGLDPDGPMPRLALSRQEAIAISRVAPAKQSFSALDFKASRATAMSAELSKYRIIHFATHGVLDLEHPELSGIVLSMIDEKGQPQDGYLRLHDIYNLNLPAELVVLSACQTGIGKQIKGEGLIALTRGFMYAGAKSVVASLWKVDDAATAELMGEFYKQMFTNKLKPAAALRAAQIHTSKQKRWQSPYYWAGFFLQGEWN
ncbi:MAG: CHAT domain-containing protein, partial [bacterium]